MLVTVKHLRDFTNQTLMMADFCSVKDFTITVGKYHAIEITVFVDKTKYIADILCGGKIDTYLHSAIKDLIPMGSKLNVAVVEVY